MERGGKRHVSDFEDVEGLSQREPEESVRFDEVVALPHWHRYHDVFDVTEEEILDRFDRRRSELKHGDDD